MSVMIEIRKIKQPVGYLYHKEENGQDIYLGGITDYAQFLDIRAQIKEKNESGYYIMFNGVEIIIDRMGNLSHYPDGFFGDIETGLLLKLV